ncbi:hypothetical protein AAG906_012599 [Vitis piasezkii]
MCSHIHLEPLSLAQTHRDALIRALSKIRVDTTTILKGLIHFRRSIELHALYFQMMIYHQRGQIMFDPYSLMLPVQTIENTTDSEDAYGYSHYTCHDRVGRYFILFRPMLQISHSEDDLHLTGFTFDEVQVVSLEDDNRDMVPMYFDQYNNTLVLNMMRGMSYMPGLGLGHRQQGPREFAFTVDHDIPYGSGYTPSEEDA